MIYEVQGPSTRTATIKFSNIEDAIREAATRIFTTPATRDYVRARLAKGESGAFVYGFSEVHIAVK